MILKKTYFAALCLTGALFAAYACTGPSTAPAPVQLPVVDAPAAPPAANVSVPEPVPVPEPPAHTPAPVPPSIPTPTPDPPEPGPGPNEIWIVGNEFVPPVVIVAEAATFSWTNKNAYAVRIVPSPSSTNVIIYTDPVTNQIMLNGANFNGLLPPGGSATLTLPSSGAFIFYCDNNTSVTGTILVGG